MDLFFVLLMALVAAALDGVIIHAIFFGESDPPHWEEMSDERRAWAAEQNRLGRRRRKHSGGDSWGSDDGAEGD